MKLLLLTLLAALALAGGSWWDGDRAAASVCDPNVPACQQPPCDPNVSLCDPNLGSEGGVTESLEDGGGGSGNCYTINDVGQWKNIGGGLFECVYTPFIGVYWDYRGPA